MREQSKKYRFQAIFETVIPTVIVALLLFGAVTSREALAHSTSGTHSHITSISDPLVSETDGTVTFEITCDCPLEVNATVFYRLNDGTATAGSDYVDQGGATTNFVVVGGTGTETYSVVATIINDSDVEPDEDFELELIIGLVGEQASPSVGAPSFFIDDQFGTATIQSEDTNTPPTADAGGPYSVNEGGSVVLDGSDSTDGEQTATSLTYEWDLDNNGSFETPGISPPFSAAGLDGPSSKTVFLRVTDDGALSDTDTATVNIDNVPPTVQEPTFTPEPSNEGAEVTASAAFSDPGGVLDTFTCSVDYSDGPQMGTVSGNTCTGPAHIYGDNGNFQVTVSVTDDDAGEGQKSASHQVDNVNPTVMLDKTGAISFPGGDAFLGSQGVEQNHDADANDPGSDDLTFEWTFVPNSSTSTTTYFNDTTAGNPDPLPSPGGTFPFSASDNTAVTFPNLGLYTVKVDVTDDDSGTTSDELEKLVTGDSECAYSQGFWGQEFLQQRYQHIDVGTLEAFIDMVGFASSVFSFSGMVPLSDISDAEAVFALRGPNIRDHATQQALAAWLNFASGAVGWDDEIIDIDGDTVPETLMEVIEFIETILLDPFATQADLVLANDLADVVNLLDADDPACEL